MKENRKLISLIVIVLLMFVINYMGASAKILAYLLLLVHFYIILTAKNDELLPIVLFNHTCSGMYDNFGFTYLFNFTLFICTVKLILAKTTVTKNTIMGVIIIFLYNIIITILNNYFSLSSALSTCSLFISYVFLILIVKRTNEINYDKCYKYFFYGFVASAISSLSIPLGTWGLEIPSAFRFCGYLRDPNYFSIDALLLMGISLINNKRFNKDYFIIFCLSIVSISKMLLILSFINFFVYLIINLFRKNKASIALSVCIILMLPVMVSLISRTAYFDLVLDKYVYRSQASSLFTGRDYLQKYYVNVLFEKPNVLIFGSSLDYKSLLGAGHDSYTKYYNFGAHNTYLDIILSWGIIGFVFFINFVKSVYLCANPIRQFKLSFEYILLLLTILTSFFALSYLNLDFFAVLILILIIYNDKVKKRIEMEESKL